jgi:hypothetical protein
LSANEDGIAVPMWRMEVKPLAERDDVPTHAVIFSSSRDETECKKNRQKKRRILPPRLSGFHAAGLPTTMNASGPSRALGNDEALGLFRRLSENAASFANKAFLDNA